jgi:hypothetical protein
LSIKDNINNKKMYEEAEDSGRHRNNGIHYPHLNQCLMREVAEEG